MGLLNYISDLVTGEGKRNAMKAAYEANNRSFREGSMLRKQMESAYSNNNANGKIYEDDLLVYSDRGQTKRYGDIRLDQGEQWQDPTTGYSPTGYNSSSFVPKSYQASRNTRGSGMYTPFFWR